MTKRQLYAYNHASKIPTLSPVGKSKLVIEVKGTKLSTIISADWLGNYFAWHASVAVLTKDGISKVPSNKASKKERLRAEMMVEKLVEGVGTEYIRRSESFGDFNLFRKFSEEEEAGLKNLDG